MKVRPHHLGELQQKTGDEIRPAPPGCERGSSVQQKEQPHRRLVLLSHRVGGLDHGPGGDHRIEVVAKPRKRLENRNLSDGVEIAPLVENQVDMGERLQPTTKRLFVLRMPLATVRILPLFGLSRTTTRSASPKG